MQELLPDGDWSMSAIIGLNDKDVENICKQVKKGFVVPANYNSIGQIVVSGRKTSNRRVRKNCKRKREPKK